MCICYIEKYSRKILLSMIQTTCWTLCISQLNKWLTRCAQKYIRYFYSSSFHISLSAIFFLLLLFSVIYVVVVGIFFLLSFFTFHLILLLLLGCYVVDCAIGRVSSRALRQTKDIDRDYIMHRIGFRFTLLTYVVYQIHI